MATWELAQGSGDTWTVPIVDENGNAIAYTGSETLAGQIWAGGTQPPLATFTPTWLTPSAGLTTVVITDSITAALTPQEYLVALTVTSGSSTFRYYLGSLWIVPTAGSDAALPVYCQYLDMVDELDWIGDLQTARDSAGFLRQRWQARSWTDNIIQRHYRGGGGLSRDNYFLPWPQYIPGNPNRLASIYRSGATDTTLQGWLNANGLYVTQPVAEANACYAIGKVLERQIGRGDGGRDYERLARRFFGRAENSISMVDAEIDSSGVAYVSTSIVIKLGNVDTLDG